MSSVQILEDEVNIPTHYRSHPSGIQAVEVTRHLDFDLGNAVKYLMRYLNKGTPRKDLMKAKWYIEDYLKYKVDANNITFMDYSEIPFHCLEDLTKIIENEEDSVIAMVLSEIRSIVIDSAIVSPEQLKDTLALLDKKIETI